jgi:transcriptional regulator with XRE-family HTH domain
MQNDTVNRDNWSERCASAGVSLELVAVLTGLSYSAVYRYKTGSRTPSDAFIEKVAVILRDRALPRPEAIA